jgi:3-dehydroquinate synthetase
VERHLADSSLPARLVDVDGARLFTPARLIEHMKQDKKVRDGKLVFILAAAIGRAVQRNDVQPQAVEALLAEQLAAA